LWAGVLVSQNREFSKRGGGGGLVGGGGHPSNSRRDFPVVNFAPSL